jgi:hypothetical protein
MHRNPFVAMALMAAVFSQALAEDRYRDFLKRGGKPRRSGRGEPGGYGKGLRKAITAKNLARRANGERMLAGGPGR